jgi:DNA-binding MarR family transcriptional regulator/GNAT superfamily N-acetyltransferase
MKAALQKRARAQSGNLAEPVGAVRRFNRFYTRRIGVLDEGHLHSEFSLAEVRVLFELAHRASPTATDLVGELDLDPGYLSRMLGRFESRQLVKRVASPRDGRLNHLELTPKGRKIAGGLDRRARTAIEALLEPLTEADRGRLLGAMGVVESLLTDSRARTDPGFVLRGPRPGDLGWVVQAHGAIYAKEYGWNAEFEGLVAGIVAHFAAHYDPARDRCWIAERDGVNIGSIFLVRHPERTGVAKLRLLLVDPTARGLGVGRRLVEECVRFARQAGYRTITLWTQSILASARRIYEAAGFRLVDEAPHRSFGAALVGQNWELALEPRA